MTIKFNGELEIDTERGVVYFHVKNPATAFSIGTVTLLRICQLPTPVPTDRQLDITHMYGANWMNKQQLTGCDSCGQDKPVETVAVSYADGTPSSLNLCVDCRTTPPAATPILEGDWCGTGRLERLMEERRQASANAAKPKLPLYDDMACINCGEHVDPTQPYQKLAVYAQQVGGRNSGQMEELESWPICGECAGDGQPAALMEYVKYSLS